MPKRTHLMDKQNAEYGVETMPEAIRSGQTQRTRVTIIVSPRERFEQAILSIKSLLANTASTYELIYIDGGSPKEIAREVKSIVTAAGHTYIRRNGFLSPNDARNIGTPMATTEFVAFVDNDVVFQPGWLSAMVACADETGAGLVSPTILVGPAVKVPNVSIHHAGGIIALTPTENGLELYRRHGFEHTSYIENKDKLIRGETGCTEFHAVLARKAMLDDIGPLDPNILGLTDEVDMAFLARQKGWSIWFEPSAVVTYAVGRAISWREIPFFCVRWQQSRVLNSERHFRAKWGLNSDVSREKRFLRDHNRHAFPMKRLQSLVGWRLTIAFRNLLCDTIARAYGLKQITPQTYTTTASKNLEIRPGSDAPIETYFPDKTTAVSKSHAEKQIAIPA